MGFPVGLKGRACFAAAVGAERGVGVAGDTRRGGAGYTALPEEAEQLQEEDRSLLVDVSRKPHQRR